MSKRAASLLAVLLLWAFFAQATRGAVNSSITFDEGIHLTAGYTLARTGDWRLQPAVMHPPFIHLLAAAPLMLDPALPDPRAVDGWDIASLSALTDTIVWQCRAPGRLALAARLPIILLATLLGALVYRWAVEMSNPLGGLIALFLYAFDPNIIAHSQLVTTDMGMTALGFATLYSCHHTLGARSANTQRHWTVFTGILLGITLATKVSSGLLVILLIALILGLGQGILLQRLGRLACIALLALGVLWMIYGLEVGYAPGIPLPLPAATHLEIYQVLQQHYLDGHPAFLLGMNSTHGWWYYFPIAFLIKTPLPTLILLVLGIGYWALGGRNHKCWILMLFPIVHFVTALFSSVNIGYRHLLPILPFIFVFISVQLSAFRLPPSAFRLPPSAFRLPTSAFRLPTSAFRLPTSALRPPTSDFRLQIKSPCHPVTLSPCHPLTLSPCHPVTLSPCLFIIALLLWYMIGAARIFPHNLAYFNELVGGPENGYRWLVDSNLDWGQNLWELRDWVQANSIDKIYYAHYSPARPEVYGIQADLLPPDPRAVPFTPWSPKPGLYAIGATVLQGAYMADVNTYAWFRSQQPVARIGDALFIYKVESPPSNAAWAAVCADPLPVLSPEAVRTYLSHADLRVILMDCHQSWAYPAGNSVGLYILPPAAPRPPHATLELEGRQADGKPFYRVYRVDRQLAAGESINTLPVQAVHDITLDGPLSLTGYWVNRAGAYPGETVELWTMWQVNQIPARPLSLMAHLVGEDGIPLAVGDGLGVPIEQWQPGDVIVQRHVFHVPEGTQSQLASIQTGAYWLDTMERWPVRQAGTISDQLKLAVIGILN